MYAMLHEKVNVIFQNILRKNNFLKVFNEIVVNVQVKKKERLMD